MWSASMLLLFERLTNRISVRLPDRSKPFLFPAAAEEEDEGEVSSEGYITESGGRGVGLSRPLAATTTAVVAAAGSPPAAWTPRPPVVGGPKMLTLCSPTQRGLGESLATMAEGYGSLVSCFPAPPPATPPPLPLVSCRLELDTRLSLNPPTFDPPDMPPLLTPTLSTSMLGVWPGAGLGEDLATTALRRALRDCFLCSCLFLFSVGEM